jgi:hypothetical protein
MTSDSPRLSASGEPATNWESRSTLLLQQFSPRHRWSRIEMGACSPGCRSAANGPIVGPAPISPLSGEWLHRHRRNARILRAAPPQLRQEPATCARRHTSECQEVMPTVRDPAPRSQTEDGRGPRLLCGRNHDRREKERPRPFAGRMRLRGLTQYPPQPAFQRASLPVCPECGCRELQLYPRLPTPRDTWVPLFCCA